MPILTGGPSGAKQICSAHCHLSSPSPGVLTQVRYNNNNNNNNNNNTIYLQLAEEIAKANKGQLYTTFTIFSKNN